MKKYLYVVCLMFTSLHYVNNAIAADPALSNLPQNYCSDAESMNSLIQPIAGKDLECILADIPRVKRMKSERSKSPGNDGIFRAGVFANINGEVTKLYSVSPNSSDVVGYYETDDKKSKISIKAKVVRNSCDGVSDKSCGQEWQGVLYFENSGKIEEHKVKFWRGG